MATKTKKPRAAAPPQAGAAPPAEAFVLDKPDMKIRQVKFRDIIARPREFAFRHEGDNDPFSPSSLGPLKESIKGQGGIHTPVLLKAYPDGSYVVTDGHRRYFALKQLIDEGVEGFTPDMLVPANVLAPTTSELVMIASALSANIEREPLGFEGRLDATRKLHQLGMPKKAIAQLLHVSDSTVERDLLLANDDEMKQFIREHKISATNAANLLAEAERNNRVKGFKKHLRAWLEAAKAELKAENEARAERDEPALSGAKAWLQNRMTPELVRAWREALEKGLPFSEPEFRFKALVHRKGGAPRIEIDSLRKDVNELAAADVAKVVQRCLDLAGELEPILLAKAAEEQQPTDSVVAGRKASLGLQRLRELGLAQLVGDQDESEEEAPEETEEDDESYLDDEGDDDDEGGEGDDEEDDEEEDD